MMEFKPRDVAPLRGWRIVIAGRVDEDRLAAGMAEAILHTASEQQDAADRAALAALVAKKLQRGGRSCRRRAASSTATTTI